MRVLIVKTSSLGDLIHTLPAISDAVLAIPGIRFDWVVEEAFAEIPGWHPAVERIIPIGLRRWRQDWHAAWAKREPQVFCRQLREGRYDLIIDAQGLLVKSALIALLARGPSHGLSWNSAREPWSALLYQHRHAIPRSLHAIVRVRRLFAHALGYAFDAAALDYGLNPNSFQSPITDSSYFVLLHGTSWPSKRLPTEQWLALSRLIASHGHKIYLPWGSEEERQIAGAIAAQCGNVQVLPRLNLSQLAGLLSQAQGFIGVDTGLAHLGAALGTPGVTLYTATSPRLTGAFGDQQYCLVLGDKQEQPISVTHLRYARLPTFDADTIWRTLQDIRKPDTDPASGETTGL